MKNEKVHKYMSQARTKRDVAETVEKMITELSNIRRNLILEAGQLEYKAACEFPCPHGIQLEERGDHPACCDNCPDEYENPCWIRYDACYGKPWKNVGLS